MSGDLIQNPVKRDFDSRVAFFSSGNLTFDLVDGALADEHDVKLFDWRLVEIVVEHDADDVNSQV